MEKQFIGTSHEVSGKAWPGMEWLRRIVAARSTQVWGALDTENLKAKKQEFTQALTQGAQEVKKGVHWGWHFVADADPKGNANLLKTWVNTWLRNMVLPQSSKRRFAPPSQRGVRRSVLNSTLVAEVVFTTPSMPIACCIGRVSKGLQAVNTL